MFLKSVSKRYEHFDTGDPGTLKPIIKERRCLVFTCLQPQLTKIFFQG